MEKKSGPLLIVLLLAAWASTFLIRPVVPDTGNIREPDEWFALQRMFPYGTPDYQSRLETLKRLETMRREAMLTRQQADWQFTGPLDYGGRVTDLEMPEGSQGTLYLAAASGGILKSYDLGQHWFPVFDGQLSLAVGDMAISPADTSVIYAGTGEPNAGGGSLAYDGNGIYRSTDGGQSWQAVGLANCGSTGKIAIHPYNPSVIYAAMMGYLFKNSSDRGIYRSQDGGLSWQKVLFINDSTGGIDVAIHPTHPDTVFATTWERIRRPDRRVYGGAGSAIYRSNDGGDTWTKLTVGLPVQQLGRINLAVSSSNPDKIYASIVGKNGELIDVYRSANGGNSWTALNAWMTLTTTSYDWWFGGIKVSPHNENDIYMLMIDAYRSTNGGTSWQQVAPAAHVDHHALYFHPQQDGFMILGNDGGINITYDHFSTYTGTNIQNLPIAQLYAMDVAAWDTGHVIVGAQDNGCYRKTYQYGYQWQTELWGDGVNVRLNQADTPNTMLTSYQYGGFYFMKNGSAYSPSGFNPGERFNWKSPFIYGPQHPSTVLAGGTRVYKSINYGHNFAAISPDLTNGPGSASVVFGTVFCLAMAPSDSNYIYAGTDDGNVWRTTDGGLTWIKISQALPKRWVTSLEIHPADPQHAWVTFSGYRYGENIAHVYETYDAGMTWTDLGSNLPDVPVNDILYDTIAGRLYLATDYGVFFSANAGLSWQIQGTSMPLLPVSELVMNYQSHTLFAATYGRGIYKLHLGSSVQISEIPGEFTLRLFPNPAGDYLYVSLQPEVSVVPELTLYSSGGHIVKQEMNAAEDPLCIGLSGLSPGIYYLEINCGKERRAAKIIKK